MEISPSRFKNYYAENAERLRAYSKKFRIEHPDIIKAQRERHRKNNRASLMWSGVKKSALDKGVGFDLTKEWIQTRLNDGICEMSGVEFDMDGKRTPNSPSVDRIIPGGSYTQENCRIILWSINRALNNFGEEYILDIFSKIISRR